MRLAVFLGPVLAAALASAALGQATPDGATIFARCAACHTATGAGVPGAYPPLNSDFRNLATRADGRRYLTLAVVRGLTGPLTIEDKPYRGVMPAQAGLDNGAVAAVLNHVGSQISKSGPAFRPFTAAEVARARAGASALTGADVARLHSAAGGR